MKRQEWITIGVACITAFLFWSFRSHILSPNDQVKNDTLAFRIPAGWPKPAYDFIKHPVTRQGFELGRRLFYDPLLSGDSTISCASCHLQRTAFTHVDHAVSHGIGDRRGTRNSLALVNLAWSASFMWDGGVNHLEVQPLAPIQSEVEMHSSLNDIIRKIRRSKYYHQRFIEAFGDTAITGTRVLKALAQFVVMLQSSGSKYDQVMRKDPGVAFTPQEAHGLKLFRKNCASCHAEPLFTNNQFANNGLEPDSIYRDGGRIKITRSPGDSLKFRVPTLRNIELSYQYMHDGRFRNLQMVLFHYNDDIHATINLAPQLKRKMKLSAQDKYDVIAFLKTLTDEDFLRDPRFGYPGPLK